MALNKRKVLEAARKHAQKGAKAKALKEYEKLLKADPRDAKLLLEVGDAYRRWGQAAEAIAQYGKVAQQYRQDGFDARAVAVFKQILNLDPKHYAAYVSLSELYQRMGLDSEAISALQTAADGYHKEGRKAEALDLLRQTAALDPTNTTSRLKVAELLRQEGMESEALAEYKAVAAELENQQDRDQLIAVRKRILELKPDEVGTLSALVRNLMSAGDLAGAEPFAISALDAEPEPPQYELLMDLYAQAGNDAKLADTTRNLAKLHRDRGDDEKARDLMQRLPVEDLPSSSRLAVDVSEVAEPELDDEELLEDEPFLALSEDAVVGENSAPDEDELSLDLGVDDEPLAASEPAPTPTPPAPAAPAASTEPESLPEGDPDQLLAEANVYLRYGKRDQAIASLRGVIAQDADHRAAHEKLGEAYAEGGQTAEAVDAWSKAAAQVREAGDADALAVLKDRIAALDPVAAEQIGSVEVTTDDAPDLDLDLDVDVDLDLDVPGGEDPPGLDLASEDDEFEIEIDASMDLDSDAATDDAAEPESAASGSVSIDETTPDFGDDSPLEFEFETDDASEAPSVSAAGQSSTSAAKIEEELEEAEFYLAQDMFDEAETILKRVLEMAPNHPSAMLRMGEIAAARDAAMAVDVTAASDPPSAETSIEVDMDAGLGEADDEFDVEIDMGEDENEAIAVDVSPTETALEVEPDIVEEADEDDTLSDVSEDAELVVETEAPAEEAPVEAPDDGGESFDLREALADVLVDEDEKNDENETSGVLSTVEDGFGSIFSDFKKGVSETLDEGDYETRYDLGIAYREMGLFEDAIGEFRVCLDSPARRFDSLYLMGICARQLTRHDESVNFLEQALALPEIPTERLAGVYFDLSLAQQGVGEVERACDSIRKVIELDADFPGAAERLAALESGEPGPPTLGEPGEGFESFDELFGDDNDDESGDAGMVEAVPAETFESFDDVIEEAETISEAGEAQPVAEVEAVVEADPNEDSKATTKSRKKKISFI